MRGISLFPLPVLPGSGKIHLVLQRIGITLFLQYLLIYFAK